MNKAILMGRLTKDPELRTTSNNISVCTFTLAVDRNYKNRDGERQADFIPVVTWRQTAEFAHRNFVKGQRVAVVGSIQTRHYDDQSGQRRYITEVVADEVHFADSKRDNMGTSRGYGEPPAQRSAYSGGAEGKSEITADDFMPASEDDATTLPFDTN